MKAIILFLLMGIMLLSCNSSKQYHDDPSSAQQPRQKRDQITIPATPTYKDIGILLTTYPSNLRDSINIARGENQPFKSELHQLLQEYSQSNNKDWKPLDKAIRSLISSHKSNPYVFVLRQQAAAIMLLHPKVELLQYDDKQSLEAIAYYTDQLDKANSDAVPLMYFCLHKLNGYWDTSKIAKLATRALNRYENNSKQQEMVKEVRKGLSETNGNIQANQKFSTKLLAVEDFSFRELQLLAGSTTAH